MKVDMKAELEKLLKEIAPDYRPAARLGWNGCNSTLEPLIKRLMLELEAKQK